MNRIILVITLLSGALAHAQIPVDNFSRDFGEFVREQLQSWNVPSVAVSVVKDGKLVLAEGYGYRDPENKKPADGDTQYAIGSCSKAFTATTIGILVDQGKLQWDSKVVDLIPGFVLKDPIANAQLTPVDMLSHRSGLPRHDGAWYGTNFTREELIHNLRHLEPSAEFRERFQYNNLMFMTAGYVVEHVSGKTWEAFTQEHLLDPLGMTRANFSVEEMARDPNHALPFEQEDGKNERVPYRGIDAVGPAGSINASAREMANWMLLNLGEGEFDGKRIIEAATLQRIHLAHTALPRPYDEPEFGPVSSCLGWGVSSYRGQVILTHSGGIDGYRSTVWLLPNAELGITILNNVGGPPINNILVYRAIDLLLGMEPIDWASKRREEFEQQQAAQEEDKPVGGTRPTHALVDYAGEYVNPGYGSVTIVNQGPDFNFTFHTFSSTLKHWHYNVFTIADTQYEDTKVTFHVNEDGAINSLAIDLESSVGPIVFERKKKE
jgi:CubicO group peptidase (beta-lactamase class C family)